VYSDAGVRGVEFKGDKRMNKVLTEHDARQGYNVRIMKATMDRPNYRVENIAKRIAKELELEENDPRFATIVKLARKNNEKVLNKALKVAIASRQSRRAKFKAFVWEVSELREREKLG
jgi:hypothetical protein